jgi:hypothetical protein
MKIRPVEAELFHADRLKDRRDEANSYSSQFCERHEKGQQHSRKQLSEMFQKLAMTSLPFVSCCVRQVLHTIQHRMLRLLVEVVVA